MGCIDVSQFNVNFKDTSVDRDLDIDSLVVDFTGEGYSGEVSERALESNVVTNALEVMLVESAFFVRPYIKTTLLTAIRKIAAGVTFFTDSSGANYIKEGDDGDLRDGPDAFKKTEQLQIYLNGSNLVKGEQVMWSSKWSFVFGFGMDPGDSIKIIS